MTISTVFRTLPNAMVTHQSGRQYTANSSGLLTVSAPDDTSAGGIGAQLTPLYRTGATTDRPNPTSGNNFQSPKAGADSVYLDTSLSGGTFIFWVGTALSTTGWINQSGSSV
jgi:hypothetical protein